MGCSPIAGLPSPRKYFKGFFMPMSDLGFTHIYENVRTKMGISRDEYALCNYVQTWSCYPDNERPGWCDRTQKQIADWIGITDRGVRKMIARMEEIGLLKKDLSNANLKITKRWFEAVTEAKVAEQSSSDMRNKVPTDAEQSSSDMRNKVPTHNKYNSKYNKQGSKTPGEKPASLFEYEVDEPQNVNKKRASKGRENWTAKAKEMFDQTLEELQADTPEYERASFNWGAVRGKHFAHLKQIREAMIPDIEKKLGRDSNEQDIQEGFAFLFRYGFEYLKKIADREGGPVQFSPSTILNCYNQIINYARTSHKSAQPKPRKGEMDTVTFYKSAAEYAKELDRRENGGEFGSY
jgi:hypothetical protein